MSINTDARRYDRDFWFFPKSCPVCSSDRIEGYCHMPPDALYFCKDCGTDLDSLGQPYSENGVYLGYFVAPSLVRGNFFISHVDIENERTLFDGFIDHVAARKVMRTIADIEKINQCLLISNQELHRERIT